jgi:hypothetical protein
MAACDDGNGLPGSAEVGNFLAKHNDYGFHGGDYEEWRILGCYAVWLL